MDLSSLPAYPKPEPPAPVAPWTPPGRGTTMLLQALFLLAFWGAVFVFHELPTTILRACEDARQREQRARDREAAIERIAGRWESVHGDGAILNFDDGRFSRYTLTDHSMEPGSECVGYFEPDAETYVLSPYSGGAYRARITGDELEIEFGAFGRERFEKRKDLAIHWDGVWRFRRPKKIKPGASHILRAVGNGPFGP